MNRAVVYDRPNRRHGHLLIADKHGRASDYTFTNEGGGVIRFRHMAGPSLDLTPAQLRQIANYCNRMADRLEKQ